MSATLIPYLRDPTSHGVTVVTFEVDALSLVGSAPIALQYGLPPSREPDSESGETAIAILARTLSSHSQVNQLTDTWESVTSERGDPRLSPGEIACLNPPNGIVARPFQEGGTAGCQIVAALPAGLDEIMAGIQELAQSHIRYDGIKSLRRSGGLVFLPYFGAAMAWLDTGSTAVQIPAHLKSWVTEAMLAWRRQDWRMVMVASGIIAEAILVEIWQEDVNEPPPEISVGKMLEQVAERVPSLDWKNAKRLIQPLIKLRNDAVHRFMASFTQDDAFLAIRAAIETTLWYQTQLLPRWHK